MRSHRYEYVGEGAYVPGVPARDLTEEEWKALSADQRRAAKGLYRRLAVKEAVVEEVEDASNES